MIERWGEALFRAGLLLLPRDFRARWKPDLLDVFRERQARARRRFTVAILPALWIYELAGLARSALAARRPDAWTRRTAPRSGSGRAPADRSPGARSRGPFTYGTLMTQLTSDLRFAARTFARRPGMSLLAVASLSLGIGASTAMFSVVDSVLLKPLPYEAPEELARVYTSNPQWADHPTLSGAALRGIFSAPEFFWVQENQRVFEHLGGYFAWGGATLSGDGPAEELDLVRATPGLLEALAVRPLVGRAFTDEDDPEGGARSVLLTEALWTERFGRDRSVVGTTLRLDDEPFTVIGVLPRSVEVATSEADAWVLVTASTAGGGWQNHSMSGVVGRLRDGVTLEQAREDVTRLLAEAPEVHGHGGSVFPALEDATRGVRAPLLVLIAGAFLLLAVGCGNVAALLLGAGIDREQEIAVRGALGAGRGRLARQLLTESLVLAGVGALGGVALAAGLSEVLLDLAPPGVPRIGEVALDARVLGFAVAVSVAGGVLFGMVPALGLSRPDLGAMINSARGTTAGRGRIQGAVVVGELALATVLLVSAALLGRTLFALNSVDVGLDPEGLYEVRMAVPFHRFDSGDGEADADALETYFGEIVEAVRTTPGVGAVAVTSKTPLGAGRANNNVYPEGWDPAAEDEELIAERRFVSDGYFGTLGIELVEGRDFEAADNRADAAGVMVISEGLARRAWPEEPAVGKQVSFWGFEPYTVIGVATDLHDERLERETTYAFYVPWRRLGQIGNLMVRLDGDPGTVLPAVRARIAAVDPSLPVTAMRSFEEIVATAVSDQRYRARLMVAFALMAALFALMGVYGVVARSVARRTREVGIRIALGAKRLDVHSLVLIQGFRLAVFGGALGLAGSAWATRFLEEMLFGVEAMDVATMAAIAVLVGAASLVASVPPSRRATRVDPTEALRAE